MKKEWSGNWNSSVQPRKQRKFRYNAPLHVRQKFVSVNLSPELRKRFGTRSMQVRKGDEIRVVRGDMKKKTGVVDKVDINKSKIYVDEIKVKKVDGSEVQRPMQPSNLMITKLKLDDKKRQAILDRVGSSEKAEPKPAKSAEPKPAKSAEPKPVPSSEDIQPSKEDKKGTPQEAQASKKEEKKAEPKPSKEDKKTEAKPAKKVVKKAPVKKPAAKKQAKPPAKPKNTPTKKERK